MNDTGLRQAAIAAAITAAFSFSSMPAQAQGTGTSGASSAPSAASGSGKASGNAEKQAQKSTFNMRASQLIGKEVRNARGENLGKIQDLFVDAGAQRVHYAVLSFDPGILADDKLFAFPMTAFRLSRDRGEMVLDVPQDRLRTAPGFQRETWPNYGDGSYFEELRQFFGEARQQSAATRGMLRGSELIGRGVNDRRGGDAGKVQDFVVDISRGRVSYVVLDFEKGWSLGGKILPLPLSAFTFPRERGEDLVLNIERERLDMARGFEQNAWPYLNAPALDQDMRAYFLTLERPKSAGTNTGGAENSSGTSK